MKKRNNRYLFATNVLTYGTIIPREMRWHFQCAGERAKYPASAVKSRRNAHHKARSHNGNKRIFESAGRPTATGNQRNENGLHAERMPGSRGKQRIFRTIQNAGTGYPPFQAHPEITDNPESNEYFEQYKMREQGARSVQAWSDFYDTEDLLDVYLEKQGYPTN